jgi:flagellar protein FliS
MTVHYSNVYLETQAMTSNPLSLVVALYESAIAKVARAMRAVEEDDKEKRGEMTSQTAEILLALSNALDFTQSNKLAGRLFALYNFLMRQLLEANRNNDIEILQEVKSTLGILLSGWQNLESGATAAPEVGVHASAEAVESRVSFQMFA